MSVLSPMLDLLFPRKCPFCRRLLEREETILCSCCQRDLPWTQGLTGERTGEFFERCVSPLWYQDTVRVSHHRYKFNGVRSYTAPYATLMAQCAADRLEGGFDMLTWVPLSAKRRRKRGYDQSELLARELGRQLGLPVERLLDKVRDTSAQSGLKGESTRRANVLDAYRLHPGAQAAGKRILLVDDVVTTGATLSECARVLRTAGAAGVECVTLARA